MLGRARKLKSPWGEGKRENSTWRFVDFVSELEKLPAELSTNVFMQY